MYCARILGEHPQWASLMEFLETSGPADRIWAEEAVLELREQLVPRFADGGGYLCGPGIRPCACGYVSAYLCDHVDPYGRTCDRPLCRKCRTPVGRNKDLCPAHAAPAPTPDETPQRAGE